MADAVRREAHGAPVPASHFATYAQQEHAAHLGMWVFLASEVLLFAGLFALYGAYRAMYPAGFVTGVEHGTKLLGSLNTGVLLCSSYAVASAVLALRGGRPGRAVGFISLTVLLGLGFLVIKFTEYGIHFHDGIYPGGQGRFFATHREGGVKEFFTLYFIATGLHAIHVTVGMCVLGWLGARVASGKITPATSHPLALGAMYWHLVDVVWIFLWPLFYLTGRG